MDLADFKEYLLPEIATVLTEIKEASPDTLFVSWSLKFKSKYGSVFVVSHVICIEIQLRSQGKVFLISSEKHFAKVRILFSS
jgi:hypothetical protein